MFGRLHRRVQRIERIAAYRTFRVATSLLAPLSLDSALSIADRVGTFTYFASPKRRRRALTHIEALLGDSLSDAAYRRIARATSRHMACLLCEMAKLDAVRERLDEYVDVQGWENLETARAPGRGAMAVAGLVGNWELISVCCAARGIHVAAISKRIYDRRLNHLLVDFRRKGGVQTIARESPSASREIQKVLTAGGVLTMLVDRDIGDPPATAVPLFGRIARTPIAAAAFAVRNQLPVLPAFAQRRPEGGHRVTFLPPIQPGVEEDRRQAIVNLARRFNEHVESAIRRNPVESLW